MSDSIDSILEKYNEQIGWLTEIKQNSPITENWSQEWILVEYILENIRIRSGDKNVARIIFDELFLGFDYSELSKYATKARERAFSEIRNHKS